MGILSRRAGSSLVVRLAAGLAAAGVVCMVASVLTAYLFADHSSSDSSPSSLTAIGLGGLGLLLLLFGVLLVIGGGLERLWRRARTPAGGAPGRSSPRRGDRSPARRRFPAATTRSRKR